jgi:predicted dehydrogenase
MARRHTRRRFLQGGLAVGGAIATTGFWTERSPAESKSANEQLNIGIIACGGRGGANLRSVAAVPGVNIVALCDADENNLDAAANDFSDAKKYFDFRELLNAGKDIDAVVVSTPEHIHAVATMMAIKMGKHVYCEKPLAHSLGETRAVREAAKKYGVVTQMGTQIHAEDNYRRVVELVQGGAIGPVTEAHVWVSRDWGGGSRPTTEDPIPKWLHWDLWQGPVEHRPFSKEYVPGPKWYKFWAYGGGVLPDLGSHWNDLPYWALKLGVPKTIEAEGPPVSPDTAPPWLIVRWEHEARDGMPAVKHTWYQGGKRPELVTSGKTPDWKDGVLFVGEKGMILADYGKHMLLPQDKFKDFKPPAPSIPKSLGHHAEWIHAIRTGGTTTCNFDYSGNLTESNLLGNVAYRVGKKLEWDPVAMTATNCPQADPLIKPHLYNGYTL